MAELAEDATRLGWERSLLEYVVKLAKVNREEIRFVILEGSAAEGKDEKGSDYDVVVGDEKGLAKAVDT